MYLDYIIGLLERWYSAESGPGRGRRRLDTPAATMPPVVSAGVVDPWLEQTAVSCPAYFSQDDCGVPGAIGTVKGVGRYLLSTVVYLLTEWKTNTGGENPKDIVDRLCVAYPKLPRKNISDHVHFVTSSCAASMMHAVTTSSGKVNNDSAISFHYRVLNKYMGNRVAEVINAVIVRPERMTRHPYICDGGNQEILPIEAKNWYVYSYSHLQRVIDHVFRTCATVTAIPQAATTAAAPSFIVNSTGEYSNEFCSVHIVPETNQYITYNVHTQLQLKRMLRMMTSKWWWGGQDEQIIGVYVDYTYANSAYGHRNNYQYVPPAATAAAAAAAVSSSSASSMSAAAAAAAATDINFDSTSKVVYDVLVNGSKRILITDRLVESKLLEDVIINEWFVFPVASPAAAAAAAAAAASSSPPPPPPPSAQPRKRRKKPISNRSKRHERDILSILLSSDDDDDAETSSESESDSESEEPSEEPQQQQQQQTPHQAPASQQQPQQQTVWSQICSALEAVTLAYVLDGNGEDEPELRILSVSGNKVGSYAEAATVVAMLNSNACVVATADKRTMDANREPRKSNTNKTAVPSAAAAAAESYVTVCVCTRSFHCDRKRLSQALRTHLFERVWPDLGALDAVSMTKREFKVVAHLHRYGYDAFVGMVKRLKCVHVPYTIPDCDMQYVNMVLDSVAPSSIYRKRFDRNIVTTYSRRARIVWFNHVASCSPIVLVDYANSGNVYYFYKTSAPYLHTFVTYIIPNAHRDLLRCDSEKHCGSALYDSLGAADEYERGLVVDVGHTFLDFVTLIVVHESLHYDIRRKRQQRKKQQQQQQQRQRIDFVLWEGKGMERSEPFRCSFEKALYLPCMEANQPHATVILDMNDPGRMLFDRRIRYSVDIQPPEAAAAAAAESSSGGAWWATTRSLLGGRFTPNEMVMAGMNFSQQRVGNRQREATSTTRAVVYAYISTHHSAHVFEAVTVTYPQNNDSIGRRYGSYRDLVNHRMGWAASMHRQPTNEWTCRDVVRILPDTSCILSDGIDISAPIQAVTPVTFETLSYLKVLTKERPVTAGELACTTGLHAFVEHHYERKMDERRVDGLAEVLARNVIHGAAVVDAVRNDDPSKDRMSRWREIRDRVGMEREDLLERLDAMLLQRRK